MELISGSSYMSIGIVRLIRAIFAISEVASQLHCLQELFVPFVSQILSVIFAVTISVDRLIAVAFPNEYRFISTTYIVLLTTFGWGYSILIGGFYFYQASDTLMFANCNLVSIMTSGFFDFQNIQTIVMETFTTLVYILVLCLMRYKLHTAQKKNQNLSEIKKLIERQTTVTLSSVMFAYLVTQVLSTIGLAAVAYLNTNSRNMIAPFIRLLPIINSGINFWIYIWRSSEFRSAFMKTFRNNKTAVHSITLVLSGRT